VAAPRSQGRLHRKADQLSRGHAGLTGSEQRVAVVAETREQPTVDLHCIQLNRREYRTPQPSFARTLATARYPHG